MSRPRRRWLPTALWVGFIAVLLVGASPSPDRPGLDFAARVEAQEVIERLYYRYQTGARDPFDVAVPREVLRRKVEIYLLESAALETFWSTPVTPEMLAAEAARIQRNTRFPDRLSALYAALGHDSVLFQETYARATLVHRLVRGFYARDQRIHALTRARADRLRTFLDAARPASMAENAAAIVDFVRRDDAHLESSIIELRNTGDESLDEPGATGPDRVHDGGVIPVERLRPARFAERLARISNRVGEPGPVLEETDRFIIETLLGSSDDHAIIAVHAVPKRTWEEWWGETSGGLDPGAVAPVAEPTSLAVAPTAATFCADAWDNGILQAPSNRTQHTAVWTGSVMIIWGGIGGGLLNTGARYDPLTDTWSPTTMLNAPDPRDSHTAIWTGTEMIIWGGTIDGAFDTGARYDPVADTWAPIAHAPSSPSTRGGHTAVWTGSRMIIWGGAGAGGGLSTNWGARYDPATDTWALTSTTNAPQARSRHTAVWTGGRMIVWGGYNSGVMGRLATGGLYDPATDTWTATATTGAPLSRDSHTAVWTGSRLVVWGGFAGVSETNTGGIYDPGANAWVATATTGAPSGRQAHSAIWTGTRMVVWGGTTDSTGGLFDPSANSWQTLPTANAPAARSRHTAVFTGDSMIIWGGSGVSMPFNHGGRFRFSTSTWTPVGPVAGPEAYVGHSMVWTGTHVIVWGGVGNSNQFFNTGSRYDPLADTWTRTTTSGAPTPREGHTAIWTGSRMVVWGGIGAGAADTDTGGRYDPVANNWTPTAVAGAATARSRHTAVWTGTEMLVWGGVTGGLASAPVGTGGRYNPATDSWATLASTGAPAARSRHTAVWAGNRMIVWGGTPASVLDQFGDGGRYDPSTDTWAPVSTSGSPTRRDGHSAISTADRMIVWGGWGVDTSWTRSGSRYDPSTDLWSSTTTIGAPTVRSGHTAVWTGEVMLVWGGYGGAAGLVNTGGRYDPVGNAWVATTTASAPEPRDRHRAIWTGRSMIVWGGQSHAEGGLYLPDASGDADGDGVTVCRGDCADGDPATYPEAPQVCDGRNNDCSSAGWPSLTGTNEADGDLDGFSGCTGDCDDARATVYPGAPQICDGLNNDCNHASWPSTSGTNDGDSDGDGQSACGGDCSPSDRNTYAGAPERNDSRDNGCPGDLGYGLVDEIEGISGFSNPSDSGEYSWQSQPGATLYQIARAAAPDFSAGCSTFTTPTPPRVFPDDPVTAAAHYFLVRALQPFTGSWGRRSSGVERSFVCGSETDCLDGIDNDADGNTDCEDPDCLPAPACQPRAFTFTDTFADDIVDTAVFDFFTGIAAAPTDYLFFEILKPTGSSSLCSARADFYRDSYLLYAPTGANLPSGSWEKWFRLPATGGNWVFDSSSYLNRYGAGCFVNYSWCPEWEGFFGQFFQVVHPAHFNPSCETVDALVGCSNGTWQFTLKVGPSRLATCGF